MIVIAIIGILIGVGIPAWRYMVRNGNENAAVRTLMAIRDAQIAYANQHKGEFGTFGDLQKEKVLNDDKYNTDTPQINGYNFVLKVVRKSPQSPPSFTINANPVKVGETGGRYFFIDDKSNNVRANSEKEAGPEDPTV